MEKKIFVYAGKRSIDSGKTVSVVFYKIEDYTKLINKDETYTFDDKRRVVKFIIGKLYEIECDESTFRLNAAKFIQSDTFDRVNKDIINEFYLLDRATREGIDNKKNIDKLLRENPIIEKIVEPLGEIRKRLNHSQRTALLSYIIHHLTKY